jgi:hypothetical protein
MHWVGVFPELVRSMHCILHNALTSDVHYALWGGYRYCRNRIYGLFLYISSSFLMNPCGAANYCETIARKFCIIRLRAPYMCNYIGGSKIDLNRRPTSKMPASIQKRKAAHPPRPPYSHRKPASVKKNLVDKPKTSARPPQKDHRDNLTLADWILVFRYIDDHPLDSQQQIVNYFSTRSEGALLFNQSTLSRKLKQRSNLEDRVGQTPNALSSKRPRAVVRPDIEEALVLWVRHMEEKREVVNGPMLITKRAKFEEMMNIPKDERLEGGAWVSSFCRTYKLKQWKAHGEAGSVDMQMVSIERIRVGGILAGFVRKDMFNMDETGFFPL